MKAGPFASLSVTECNILQGISEGRTNSQIGESLGLASGTVRNYVSGLLVKLSCENRAGLAAYAIRHRLEASRYWKAPPSDIRSRVGKIINHATPIKAGRP